MSGDYKPLSHSNWYAVLSLLLSLIAVGFTVYDHMLGMNIGSAGPTAARTESRVGPLPPMHKTSTHRKPEKPLHRDDDSFAAFSQSLRSFARQYNFLYALTVTAFGLMMTWTWRLAADWRYFRRRPPTLVRTLSAVYFMGLLAAMAYLYSALNG